MSKDFTLYPEAFELKQLGFDEPCFAWYNLGDTLLSDITMGYEKTDFLYTQDDMEETQCTAPTYSQAFRWFREKYNIEGITQHAEDRLWYKFHISTYLQYGKKNIHAGFEYTTHEEAELACLKKLIEIVKENQK
jgi:hypothetical protein